MLTDLQATVNLGEYEVKKDQDIIRRSINSIKYMSVLQK